MEKVISILSLVVSVISIVTAIIIYILTEKKKVNNIVHFCNDYFSSEIGENRCYSIRPQKKLFLEKNENNVTSMLGGFINMGRDIEKNDIEFDIIFPKNCRVMYVKVKPSNQNIVVNYFRNSNNNLHFKVENKFLHYEYFKYCVVLASTEEINDLHDKLFFNHRITETDLIKSYYLKQSKLKRFTLWSIIAGLFEIFIFLYALFFYCFRNYNTIIPAKKFLFLFLIEFLGLLSGIIMIKMSYKEILKYLTIQKIKDTCLSRQRKL